MYAIVKYVAEVIVFEAALLFINRDQLWSSTWCFRQQHGIINGTRYISNISEAYISIKYIAVSNIFSAVYLLLLKQEVICDAYVI